MSRYTRDTIRIVGQAHNHRDAGVVQGRDEPDRQAGAVKSEQREADAHRITASDSTQSFRFLASAKAPNAPSNWLRRR
ncbi:hypothetical protein MGN01_44730 [Methylobacterium gnaphalii]|uniref:Uncharacterized protein n=1 Tax=Methylobacterium gnaphalii TaxID=1010610 RepID=A0A512JRN9_9HYPH|nr:hypothetical protein MGN01_44730 [Methylobacterium gnaphalii]GLS48885.1 hypothetical protein GCM10007885_17320 [Methylobacterium gnaphalii]